MSRKHKATEEYLALVADTLPASPVFLLLTYRPGYSQPFGERSYQTRIAPGPMSTGDSVAMARAMLAGRGVARRASDADRAQGGRQPVLRRGVVKSLRKRAASGGRATGGRRAGQSRRSTCPTRSRTSSWRASTGSEAPEGALQMASVIGREFTLRLLERIADVGADTRTFLRELKALELIHEKGVFPELEYIFKHALTQDVAYAPPGPAPEGAHRLIGRQSRSCTPTGWPSSTRCWRTTSRRPRSGTRRWTTSQGRRQGRPGVRHSRAPVPYDSAEAMRIGREGRALRRTSDGSTGGVRSSTSS